jgi:hypothetical protein
MCHACHDPRGALCVVVEERVSDLVMIRVSGHQPGFLCHDDVVPPTVEMMPSYWSLIG